MLAGVVVVILVGVFLFLNKDGGFTVLASYNNPIYKYSLGIPKEWQGKYEIQESSDFRTASFIYSNDQKKSPIMTLVIFNKNEWDLIPDKSGAGTELGTKDNNVFLYLAYPISQGNPYEGQAGKEFSSFVKQANLVAKTFKFAE